MEVKTIHSGSEDKKFAWHVAQVFLDKPRLGLTSIVVLSLHLNNAHAEKPVAGPNAIAEIIDTASLACHRQGCPDLDIVCGDFNFARFGRDDSGKWHDGTYNVFEQRNIIPVADYSGECCFVGVRESWVQQLYCKGFSWGEQLLDRTQEEQDEITAKFLEQCGANPRRPCLSASSRRPALRLRGPGLRPRSAPSPVPDAHHPSRICRPLQRLRSETRPVPPSRRTPTHTHTRISAYQHPHDSPIPAPLPPRLLPPRSRRCLPLPPRMRQARCAMHVARAPTPTPPRPAPTPTPPRPAPTPTPPRTSSRAIAASCGQARCAMHVARASSRPSCPCCHTEALTSTGPCSCT